MVDPFAFGVEDAADCSGVVDVPATGAPDAIVSVIFMNLYVLPISSSLSSVTVLFMDVGECNEKNASSDADCMDWTWRTDCMLANTLGQGVCVR